jgi:predicted N-acetyltransferase YhbS
VGKIADQKTAPEKRKARLTKPARLRAGHIVSNFDCDEEVMNIWLQKRALPASVEQTAMTFVVCRGRTVVGYYSLAAASLSHEECTSSLRRNSPDPIPAILLARLAVHLPEKGQGIGTDLLRDAALRTLRVAKNAAAKTLIVHPLNEKRAKHYKALGFLELRTGSTPESLHMPLKNLAAALGLAVSGIRAGSESGPKKIVTCSP